MRLKLNLIFRRVFTTPSRNSTVLPGEAIIVHDDPEDNAEKQDYVPDYMTITRAVRRNIHYLTA